MLRGGKGHRYHISTGINRNGKVLINPVSRGINTTDVPSWALNPRFCARWRQSSYYKLYPLNLPVKMLTLNLIQQ